VARARLEGAISGRERLLRASLGEPVDRPPVWLMRQAGRYLPEYRAIRARASFLEMARDADLAAEISLQPFHRFGMDGVVVFSDILLPLLGLGLEVAFDPGPRIANPIEGAADLARLEGEVAKAIRPTCEAIGRLRTELGERAAVIGFAGAPWTLAAYALESRLSRDVVALSALSYRDPALLDRLLERMAEIAAEALLLQMRAGADVLQIFDTWAGMLSVERFERFAGRALRAVIARLPQTRPPLIVYARGAAHLVDALADLGVDVVSLDWRTELGLAARRIGARVSLQGNLDPSALMAEPDAIRRMVAELVAAGRAARGHVLNLGHGVQPQTPVDGVAAFVEAGKGAGA
jgi:uroporphyrinogen decarboxylase